MEGQSMLYPRTTASRRAVSLDGMWKFQLDWEGNGRENGWYEGLPKPDLIPVPASFQDFYTEKEIREFTGDLWYETDFFLPEEWQGNEAAIRFGCATHRAEVYINGKKAGSHEGGFTPFSIKLSGFANYCAWNKVVVIVNNELSSTSLPCGEVKLLPDGKKISKPYFDFFNYSGLQRPVWLILIPKEAITDFHVVHELDGNTAYGSTLILWTKKVERLCHFFRLYTFIYDCYEIFFSTISRRAFNSSTSFACLLINRKSKSVLSVLRSKVSYLLLRDLSISLFESIFFSALTIPSYNSIFMDCMSSLVAICFSMFSKGL